MSRRRSPEKRVLPADPRFGDIMVTKFINYTMRGGKRSVSEKAFYSALDMIKDKSGQDGIEVFRAALTNVKPAVEVKSRRVGGATYQVPIEVSERRQHSLAVRWLVEFSRKRSEHTMADRLGNEMADAVAERGGAFKKRDETHRMAEANKAFSHFRW